MTLQPCIDDERPVSFPKLMEVEETQDGVFQSKTAAFAPGGALLNAVETEPKRTYGGHVYAQAVWAASHTVQKGMVVHVCR